ncbi:hypothetical protein N9562_00295 [Flavobacteriaceae bacterium]|nr:hypothetical protein [Flavobacteriaceae bacterium]
MKELTRKEKVVKAIPLTSREKRANNINVKVSERPSKASNTKTRVFGSREEKVAANGTRVSSEKKIVIKELKRKEAGTHLSRSRMKTFVVSIKKPSLWDRIKNFFCKLF